MGVLRDLSAAMTFGLSVTTKHKEAETKYIDRRIRHQLSSRCGSAACRRTKVSRFP